MHKAAYSIKTDRKNIEYFCNNISIHYKTCTAEEWHYGRNEKGRRKKIRQITVRSAV
jgi:hypothetical protein